MRNTTYAGSRQTSYICRIMRSLLVGLLLLLGFCNVQGQNLQLQNANEKYTIVYPQYLEDRDGILSFAEVIQAAGSFRTSSIPIPDFLGNFSKVIWYRFEVINNSKDSAWFLQIKGGYMHRLTLFQLSGNNITDSLTLSADSDIADRPVRSNNLIFPAKLRPGERKVFFLRATSKSLIRASMSFNTMQTLYEKGVLTSYVDGFLTALAVALLLYNLFVYFSLRERVYLYYIFYILTTILHTNLVAGQVLLFFPALDFLSSNLLLPLLAVFSIFFTNSFLQTKRYAPIIHKIRWYFIACFTMPVILFLLQEYAIAILVTSSLMFLLFFYWVLAGIMAYRKGFQPAIYYIIGFGALTTMNLVFELKILGLIAESYWIDSALYIGSALEAIILSFALASKINFYKKEKEQIQQKAYQQAVNFSRDLINMQEQERKRIASELHDSVGQKLILIKNKVLRFTKSGSSGFQQNPEALAESVADAIQEIRSISYGLRPYQIDLLGLTQSIKSLVAESFDTLNIPYTLQVDNVDTVRDADMQINIYRIIQECINNIIKHAGASSVIIRVQKNISHINIHIADNGTGFDPQASGSGFGLKGIRERLHILKGTVQIDKAIPQGTIFTIIVPLN